MSTPDKSKLRWVVVAGLVGLIALAGTGAVHYTSQPNFCGSCHEMQDLHAGWGKGSHRETSCYDCHVDKTFSGHVMAKANGLKQVYMHFTSKVDMAQVKAEVPSGRCIRCHDVSDQNKLGERRAKAHLKHREAKLECTTCHLHSGHSREVFVGFGSESCRECHSAKPGEIPNPYLKRPPCTRADGSEQASQ